MTPAEVKDLLGICGAIGAGITGVILTLRAKRERKARRRGLTANPARCEDHEVRLRELEKCHAQVAQDVALIKQGQEFMQGTLNEIKEKVSE